MKWRDELTRRFPKLTRLDADAYVVGGAIRDLLLGREPADVDVAVNDPLAAAKKIRERVIRLGTEEHLSAYRVVDGDRVYDFAEILEHDLDVDLTRRDFTINAMAVDLTRDVLLDPHGGERDVKEGVVRMVRASNFDDDPLRTIRGVRAALKYGMTIDAGTLDAIRVRAPRIAEMAPERVTYELSVIFASTNFSRALELLRAPELAEPLGFEWRSGNPAFPLSHEPTVAGAFALLIEDPRTYAERWRWSDSLLREVLTLQKLMQKHDRLALFDAGEAVARQLPPLLPDVSLDWPDFAIKPLLTGNEIAALANIAPGKELGRIIRALLEAQVMGEVHSREEAEQFVTSRF
ncbi:MAG TPA: hypothetical protein VE010_21155, partial [Thermoanaerobaculia bacterium]|nr:hypothetical protein [Thermoanaerobaculia bacterium]